MNRLEASWLAAIYAGGDNVKNTKVLVACSGGGDSVALLVFLLAIQNSLGIQLSVAHANHGLRQEAKLEADLVRNLCRSANVELFETKLEVLLHAKTKKIGLETAARELRWAWLKHLAKSNDITTVATGHNLDDHTETVMLRLARGGGAGCLIPLHRRQNLRWSPLIQARRRELREYLIQKKVTWLDDISNLEPFTPRNRWRKLLEPIRSEAPAIDRHLWESHLQIAELVAFRDRYVHSWQGIRWEILRKPKLALLLAKDWQEMELRWTLEAAFRNICWHRESNLLRDLASWMMRYLHKRPSKSKEWGEWKLDIADSVLKSLSRDELPSEKKMMPWILVKKN